MKINFSKEINILFILGLFGVSYLFFVLIQWLEHFLPASSQDFIKMFHFLTIPGIFYILLKLFEEFFWKWKIWRFLKIVDFPDLNGEYKGQLTSSFKEKDGENYEQKITLKIKQSFSSIVIQLSTNSFSSESISKKAFFDFNELKQKSCLYYFFQNTPGENATKTMQMHEGSTILCYDEKTKKLKGTYYSGRGRNNYGDIELIKE